MVSNVGLYNEMRTMSEYDWLRKRVMLLLTLSFFPEREAAFEEWELQARS